MQGNRWGVAQTEFEKYRGKKENDRIVALGVFQLFSRNEDHKKNFSYCNLLIIQAKK